MQETAYGLLEWGPDDFWRATPLELIRAARARVKMRYAERMSDMLPWFALFKALGVSVTPESLLGESPG